MTASAGDNQIGLAGQLLGAALELPPNSPNQSALNATFTVRVPRTGTYSYYCGFHGAEGTGVFGVVVTR